VLVLPRPHPCHPPAIPFPTRRPPRPPPPAQYGAGSVDYSKADPYTCGQSSIVASAADAPKDDNIELLLPVGGLPVPNVPERAPLLTSVHPDFADVGTPVPGIYRRGRTIPTITASRPSNVVISGADSGAPTSAVAPPVAAAAAADSGAPPAAADGNAMAAAPPAAAEGNASASAADNISGAPAPATTPAVAP
jgi:hypothetical protein